jgi:hypothetical protein
MKPGQAPMMGKMIDFCRSWSAKFQYRQISATLLWDGRGGGESKFVGVEYE